MPQPSNDQSDAPMASTLPLPGDPAPLPRGLGSPFVVGRPLRANEPIFGRENALRFIADQLAHYSSVNIVGERRMGKSSLINHVLGNPGHYLVAQPDQPPLVLARVDLQAHVTTAARFYGMALRELIAHLPDSRSVEALALQAVRERLNVACEATYDEFSRVLHQLRDARGLSVRPVLVVDEFESLLDDHIRPGFPFPMFYNSLRSLITEGALAMMVASHLSLTDLFRALPTSLTSNFPTYFMHFGLQPLVDAAADALLLQPSDHPLTVADAREARQWANGHPCHLQAAGQAMYEAKAGIHATASMRDRFIELKNTNCFVDHATQLPPPPAKRIGRVRRALRAIFIGVPLRLGQQAQKISLKLDDIASWLIGMAIIIVVILAVLGWVNALDVVNLVKRALGIQ
jgi:hypothetical protein